MVKLCPLWSNLHVISFKGISYDFLVLFLRLTYSTRFGYEWVSECVCVWTLNWILKKQQWLLNVQCKHIFLFSSSLSCEKDYFNFFRNEKKHAIYKWNVRRRRVCIDESCGEKKKRPFDLNLILAWNLLDAWKKSYQRISVVDRQ